MTNPKPINLAEARRMNDDATDLYAGTTAKNAILYGGYRNALNVIEALAEALEYSKKCGQVACGIFWEGTEQQKMTDKALDLVQLGNNDADASLAPAASADTAYAAEDGEG